MTRRLAGLALAAFAALVGTGVAGLAASDFDGVWVVKDTTGRPFTITLSSDGTASGSIRPDMVGTWREEGQSAVVSWKTGWTTEITRTNGAYTHSAYSPDRSPAGPPISTSDAKKAP